MRFYQKFLTSTKETALYEKLLATSKISVYNDELKQQEDENSEQKRKESKNSKAKEMEKIIKHLYERSYIYIIIYIYIYIWKCLV